MGAVVVDAAGEVVSSGRNRVYERSAPAGQLAWSLLAHAEVNALAGLAPDRRYEDHAIITALEPCLLCVGATRLATVGTLRYGAPDAYGGAARVAMRGLNPMLERLALDLRGPELGPLGTLVAALHAEFFVRRNPAGRIVAALREDDPELLAAAEELRARDVSARAAAGVALEVVLPELSDVVEA